MSIKKIISIANQKGGVGKTTTTINLATGLAAIQKKVLIIDLDPQGNASTGVGIELKQRIHSSYDLLLGRKLAADVIINTLIPYLYIIPATINLAAAEVELANLKNKESLLKRILRNFTEKFDYIIIDCPPSLGHLTINALVASDSILIPLQCEFFALEGLAHLLKTISLIKKALNPKLKIEGILLTMADRRNNLTLMVENDVRDTFKDLVFKTIIPRNIKLSEAPSHGKPGLVYDLNCSGSQAYISAAKELLKRERIYKNEIKSADEEHFIESQESFAKLGNA